MTKMVSVVHIRHQYKSGGKSIALDMLIHFKTREISGEVTVKTGGEEKRILCDSFREAQNLFACAEEWLEGVREDDVWNWDSDDEEGDEE